MNTVLYRLPRPEIVLEQRARIALPQEDPFFQGWGPKL
jgi:hypothetical protein